MYYLYDSKGQLYMQLSLTPEPKGIVDVRLTDNAEANNAGVVWYDGDVDDKYVVDGVVVDRPENPAQLEGDTLKDVPVPSRILIDNILYPCDDDTVELDLEQGTKKIVIRAWPHLDKEFNLED